MFDSPSAYQFYFQRACSLTGKILDLQSRVTVSITVGSTIFMSEIVLFECLQVRQGA